MDKREKKMLERQKQIIHILFLHPEGFSLKEIADALLVTRQTAAKDVEILKELGFVTTRQLGSVVMHYHQNHFREASK